MQVKKKTRGYKLGLAIRPIFFSYKKTPKKSGLIRGLRILVIFANCGLQILAIIFLKVFLYFRIANPNKYTYRKFRKFSII